MGMAACIFSFFLLCSFISLSSCLNQTTFRPKALVLPISKDAKTLQYVTHINQRTPFVSVGLTLDLGGPFLWIDCEQGYVSSTYRSGGCGTAQCKLAGASPNCEACPSAGSAPRPGCTKTKTCWHFPENTVIRHAAGGRLALDILSIQSSDGKSPGRVVFVPQFLFYCAPTLIVEGLASGVTGMAGLGRTKIALPSQFATYFKLKTKFALCLSSDTNSNGVVIFGDGPYILGHNFDASKFLTYTPLIINKVNVGVSVLPNEHSSEYFIGVKSIQINGQSVPINTTLLSINKAGYFGTKISTVNPYTVLETSIYNAVIKAFMNEINVTRVAPVAPFGTCFNSKNIISTSAGPNVPSIDLVLQGSVHWRIFGANSLVPMNDEVLCLGFVDGGVGPFITSIVIGGYQIEDNLLQFDLGKSRLGFSSSLRFLQTSCSNFNFTSNAN